MEGFVSIPRVARYLDVSTRSIYRLINDGDLDAIKIRGSLRIDLESLERYLKEMRETFIIDRMFDR